MASDAGGCSRSYQRAYYICSELKVPRSGIAVAAELAAHELRKAEKLEQRPSFDRTDAIMKRLEARRARDEAARLLTPPERLVGSPDTELVPALDAAELAGDDNCPVRQDGAAGSIS